MSGAATVDRLAIALIALAKHNIPPDVQELLVSGDPSRGIAPGALAGALPPRLGDPSKVNASDRFYGDPIVRFRAMAQATYPSETIDGAHFRMWCAIAADEIEAARRASLTKTRLRALQDKEG